MNKIEVVSESYISNEVSDISSIFVNDNTLNIKFNDSKSDPIELINNIYENVIITINKGVSINLIEIKNSHNKSTLNYKYLLDDNSKIIINKFNCANEYSENDDVNLNGYESNVLFNLSIISLDHNIYNININHNNKKTVSKINNHGVTLSDGKIEFIINGIIKKGMSDSILNQDNKIMTLGNGKSTIKPNLFIDEDKVEARHGASIGRFNEEEIFYLQSRGIPESIGYQLLAEGFLLGTMKVNDSIKERIKNIIEIIRR